MINRIGFFDQPVSNDERILDNIRKITNGQGDNYTNHFQLNSPNFKEYYRIIATDLSEQQTLAADPKAVKK